MKTENKDYNLWARDTGEGSMGEWGEPIAIFDRDFPLESKEVREKIQNLVDEWFGFDPREMEQLFPVGISYEMQWIILEGAGHPESVLAGLDPNFAEYALAELEFFSRGNFHSSNPVETS